MLAILFWTGGCSKDTEAREPGAFLPGSSAAPEAIQPASPTAGELLLDEINRARTNPSAYADELAASGSGAAWREAVDALRKTKALAPLSRDSKLTASAQFHIDDIGAKGLTGHDSSNGDSFAVRLRKFTTAGSIAENISYGAEGAKAVVRLWIIDDGVSSRGHRKNLLGSYKRAGSACGPHKTRRVVCVSDFSS
jgi:uncharacterized protein YkwD